MLSVFFGDMPEAIYNTNVYFQNQYRDDWLTKPLSKEIIQDVDKSEFSHHLTALWGQFPPKSCQVV